MALQPVKTSSFGGVPVWIKVLETILGGFKLITTGLTIGDVLGAGTPIRVDEAARTATVSKTGIVNANTATTSIQLKKGHQFKVGDNVAKIVGGAAYAISAIDTSNVAYDTLTVGTALGSLSAGDVLFQSSATGATAGAYLVVPNALLYSDTAIKVDEGVTAVNHGTIYQRRIQNGVTADQVTALKCISFSQSV